MKVGDTLHGYTLIEKIDEHGSPREFFRCARAGATFVMIRDEDIAQYVALHEHLLRRDIAVPRLHWYSVEEQLMVQEDLGRDSLCALTTARGHDPDAYRTVIDELVRFQVDGRPAAPVALEYDSAHIRWEQQYFIDFFLLQHAGLGRQAVDAIKGDLDELAARVTGSSRGVSDYLMHRDFQSQNIYIKDGRPRFIDFQSARIGPLTYDLAALLRDAYVHIDRPAEQELFDYYCTLIGQRGLAVSRSELWQAYGLTALQRNMQALGAFANLSRNKGRPHYARYIPRGLALLKAGLADTDLAGLCRVVSSIDG